MDFVFATKPSNELSESVEFEWTIGQYPWMPHLLSREIALTLSGGLRFQMIVSKWVYPPNHEFYNKRVSIKFGLRKSEAKKYDIHTLLLFEIKNNLGESYWKDSTEFRFFESKEEQFLSKNFKMPTRPSDIVHGRCGDLCFPGCAFTIAGKIFFQCLQEKKVSELLRKNTAQLRNDLQDLLLSKMYADVTIRVGDADIPAHKNILCSRSAVFRTMFEQNMQEKEQSVVNISDIEKQVFEVFLFFLYTGTLSENRLDVIMQLYSVADKYAVKTLLNTCSDFLLDSISVATAVSVLSLAYMHSDACLKSAAADFICEHFAAVESTDSWSELLNSDPRLATFVLKQISTIAAKNAVK